MAAETYRSGAATIRVEQDTVRRHIDRVTDGAATSFLTRARAAAEAVQVGAVAEWPVDTGLSRKSFRIEQEVSADTISVSLANDARSGRWGAYVFKIRWGRYTERELNNLSWARAQAKAAERRKLGHPVSESRIANWARYEREGSKGAFRWFKPAPSKERAGKQPWRVLVRTPGQRAGRAMVADLRTALQSLARRA